MAVVLLATLVIGYLTISFPLIGKGLLPETAEESIAFWRGHGGPVWQLGRNWFAASPIHLIEQGWKDLAGLLFIVVFVCYGISSLVRIRPKKGIFALCFTVQDQAAPQGLYYGVAAVILGTWGIVYNPLLVPFLVKLFHSSIHVYRWVDINLVLSQALIFGAIACVVSLPMISRSWNKLRSLKLLIPLTAVMLVIGLPLRSPDLNTTLVETFDNRVWHTSLLDLPNEALYHGLSQLPPGVVAVRADFAELVAALTPHVVVTVRPFRIGDYQNIKEHIADNEAIINFSVDPGMMRNLLAKHNCRYVIVPRGDPKVVCFEEQKDLFTEVLKTEAHQVFEVIK